MKIIENLLKFEKEVFMLLIFVRALVLYVLVLLVMRCMGKREIGQLQPFELTISIMIADLAASPMQTLGTPLFYGIVPILALLVMHILISCLNLKSIKFREFICGKPSILIYRGKIDEQMMKKENFTINELQERLRGNNVFDLANVEYAILETNGQITVILKPGKRTVTLEDMKLKADYVGLPYDLVIDGVIQKENLEKISKDKNWLEEQVQKFNMKVDDALIVTINGKGEIFCQKKEK